MPTCYRLTFMCCQPCLLTFQCFQSCVSWTPFCYVRHTVVSETYPSVAVSHAWSKVLITVGWIWWRHQRDPHFNLASPPSNLKPTTELTLLNSSNVIKRSLSESHSCMVRSAMCDNCSLLMFEPTSNSSTWANRREPAATSVAQIVSDNVTSGSRLPEAILPW